MEGRFSWSVFFSHRNTNSCSIITAYFGTEKFTVKRKTNRSGRPYFNSRCLTNLYNANTEREQIEVLSNLFALLTTFDINPNKHLIIVLLLTY